MTDHNERDDTDTTYYDVLGLDRSGTDEDIEAAYREQTLEYHPDNCDHPDAADLFADITQAKEALLGTGRRTDRPRHGQSLNYVWQDGTPVRPRDDELDGFTSGHGKDEDDEGRNRQSGGDDEQSTDDGPWVTDEDDIGGSDPDPDPDTISVSSDDADDSESGRGRLSRRGIIATLGLGGGALLFADQLGWPGVGEEVQPPGGTEEFVEVGPDESLQDAIDRAASGGTVELAPGTYFEAVTVEKNLTVEAPDGATLDGRDTNGTAAIQFSAPEVTIRGLRIVEYDRGGVQALEFGTDITLENLGVSNVGGPGLVVGSESITLRSVTAQDCGDTGIRLGSSPEGSVKIDGALVERSNRTVEYGDVEAEGRGITVIGGGSISITDTEALDNDHQNIRIETGDARGQAIEIINSTALASGAGSNIIVQGTGRGDDVLVEGVVSENASRRGIYLGSDSAVDSATVRNMEAKDNGDTGILIESTPEGSVEVENVLVERSNRTVAYGDVEAEGRGINVTGGTTVTVTGAEALDNGGQSIRVGAGDARGQSIEIADSTALASGSGSNVLVQGTGRGDEVLVEEVVSENADRRGIYLGAGTAVDSATIRGVETADNGDTGILLESTPEGSVTIESVVVKRSNRTVAYGDVEAPGMGINVTGGTDVSVTDVEALENGGHNIHIVGGDARGQSITIENSTANSSKKRAGVYTGGTGGRDDTEISGVVANRNEGYGLNLGGDSISITDTTAEGNELGPYNFRNADEGNVTVRNSTDE